MALLSGLVELIGPQVVLSIYDRQLIHGADNMTLIPRSKVCRYRTQDGQHQVIGNEKFEFGCLDGVGRSVDPDVRRPSTCGEMVCAWEDAFRFVSTKPPTPNRPTEVGYGGAAHATQVFDQITNPIGSRAAEGQNWRCNSPKHPEAAPRKRG